MSALPLPRWSKYPRDSFLPDLTAATAVLFLAVPQALAYATIAGLPPVMGLYAAAVPTVVGSIFRSSRHVLSGPTNALSLLVGAAVASGLGGSPVETAVTLALMVGLFQVSAGVLRLGALADYISSAVVLGYITGAAVLIAAGQLYAATGTSGPGGRIWETVGGWIGSLGETQPIAVATAVGTVAVIVLLRWASRRLARRIPSAIVAVGGSIAAVSIFDLDARGLLLVRDLSPIPSGLPPLSIPGFGHAVDLLPAAIACAMLSLVESTALARSLATQSGQRIDASTEFFGQGLSNLAAGFLSGYPVSGSLGRSALGQRVGARSRLAGVMTGLMMLAALLAFGSVLDRTPVAALAGMLFVVAYDLVDVPRLQRSFRASPADGLALVTTMLGTWALPLDTAIYVGVGISIVMFLRNARFLTVRELLVADDGRLRERGTDVDPSASIIAGPRCSKIRFLHLEGSLFFGAAAELQSALDTATQDSEVTVLVVRLKRAHGLDATSTAVLEAAAVRLQSAGRHLLLVGMTPDMMEVLERSGAADRIGRENLFPTRRRWFSALDSARERAVGLCGSGCETCPFANMRFTAMTDPDAQDA